jgi:hypothetical protein
VARAALIATILAFLGLYAIAYAAPWTTSHTAVGRVNAAPDTDGDGLWDPVDPDDDNDGICDPGVVDPSCTGSDNCRLVYNPSQTDTDDDGIGDACESGAPVGGIADLPDVSDSSSRNYVALAALSATALLALTAAGWYARRPWGR